VKESPKERTTVSTDAIKQMHDRYVMPTYAPGLALVRGKGSKVWDAEGRVYLDFLSGIAVNSLGHCHPAVRKAIARQAGKLIQVSNLYYNELQPRLAKALSERSLGGKCFFCNSGAEANEALIKLARKWGHPKGKYEVISFAGSFHGRTLATLTATGQDKVQAGFSPLPEGFVRVEFNDIEATRAAVTDKTAAILVEVVQGEGGVRPVAPEFLSALRSLCDEKGLLLLIDEVQTGMGRTGHWFGYQAHEVEPDAFSLAKGLGGGFPIGAIVTNEKLADVLTVGSHATTFGGTPLACAAALAVVETIEKQDLLAHVRKSGEQFRRKLEKLMKKHPFIQEVRGVGLMIGLVLDRPAGPLQTLLQEKGLLALATAGNVVRFLPPLNVTPGQARKAVRIVEKACAALQATESKETT
jgi:predicted acetylornithine/succinylornithine family transaminase